MTKKLVLPLLVFITRITSVSLLCTYIFCYLQKK
jgi:hypothetical protein